MKAKPVFIIATLFLGPVLLAWFLYMNKVPFSHNENGELLLPPMAVTDLQLTTATNKKLKLSSWRHHWTLMLITEDSDCGQSCQHSLYTLRQVRLALPDEQHRISRVLLTPEYKKSVKGLLTKPFKGTEHYQYQARVLATFGKSLHLEKANNQKAFIVIVDPIGNIMMRYPSDVKAKALHQDLKKLLKASQIG